MHFYLNRMSTLLNASIAARCQIIPPFQNFTNFLTWILIWIQLRQTIIKTNIISQINLACKGKSIFNYLILIILSYLLFHDKILKY